MNTKIFDEVGKFVTKNAPTILTVAGVVGVGVTSFITAQATIKAEKILAEEEKKNGSRPKGMELVKKVGKHYIPAVAFGVGTAACIIGSNSINHRRQIALAGAYIASETVYKEYKDKVEEVVGKKKSELIEQDVKEDQLKKNPQTEENTVHTGNGDTLFYYPVLGNTYFTSTIEHVRRVENEINYRMNRGDFVTINDLNELLGVGEMKYFGEEFGWALSDTHDDLFEIKLIPAKTEDEHPCLCIDYGTMPLPMNTDFRYEWWQ